MKTFSAIILVMLAFVGRIAGASVSISPEAAKIVALNFYVDRMPQDMAKTSVIQANLIHTEQENATVFWYIFSMEPSGFVIVSATDAVIPVLGYSFESIAGLTDIPENFSGWMAHYKPEMQDAMLHPERRTPGISLAWDHFLNGNSDPNKPKKEVKGVQPLIITNWDQGKYYNQFCPSDIAGPDGHCVTGCVATAMGMLLYYYRWPLTGTGSYSYTHPDYGTISADFGAATYDWNAMSNALNFYSPETAKLLFHMGASVDMDYGPNGIGMWNHKAAYSLRTYFKCVPQTTYLFRDSTNLDWDSIIVKHLDRKQILYYAGWAGVGSTSGHAFICDGYQDSTYFHFIHSVLINAA